MINQEPHEGARQAERIYEECLKATLERTHPGQFVAIEPASGDYFLGLTLNEAIAAARKAHAERLPHVLRVGHRAAIHIGAAWQAEIERRMAELDQGSVKPIPWAEARQMIFGDTDDSGRD